MKGGEATYDEQTASSTSSAMTVRPITQLSEKDRSVEDSVRPHHRREPNTNALPSTTTAAVEASSAAVNERGAESYFTAHTPSTFAPQDSNPAHDTIAETSQLPPALPAATHFPGPALPLGLTEPMVQPALRPQTPPAQPSSQPVAPPNPELPPRVHRFSLMKGGPWSPLEMIFGSALGTGAKCDLCSKRLGWKPCLECDDCSLTLVVGVIFNCFKPANILDLASVHMKCGETAPMDCEVRESQKATKPSRIPLRVVSPKPRKSPTSSPKSKSPKQHK
jgi:hypothetical protein